jgi:hypothetical protein
MSRLTLGPESEWDVQLTTHLLVLKVKKDLSYISTPIDYSPHVTFTFAILISFFNVSVVCEQGVFLHHWNNVVTEFVILDT